MLSVGRVGRLVGLTPKALRHYDRLRLFVPAHVDAAGYRWYTSDQLGTARLIARLRSVDMPLDEIRRCLDADPDTVRTALLAHERVLESRLTRMRGNLHEITHLLADGGTAMTTEPDLHDDQRLAKSLFNHVWTLLEKEDRTPADDDRMIHEAHASRYHWGEVGTAKNIVIGEWQCSRVYATLRRAEPALHHATRALTLATEAGLADWDLAFCHEAMARAHAVAGDPDAARTSAERALAVPIAEDDDRELLLGDLESVPGLERFW